MVQILDLYHMDEVFQKYVKNEIFTRVEEKLQTFFLSSNEAVGY